jgi:hypothetical protein
MAKLLDKVLIGHSGSNIGFGELCRLLVRLDFTMRVNGSHHMFERRGVTELIVIQPRGASAKAYQVRQVRAILLEYQLTEI